MLAPRFQLEVGSRLELEEAGVWYPVRVIRTDSDRVLVHFEGWSPRHDRWIDRESRNIRGRRRQMMTRKKRSAVPSAPTSEDETKSKDKDRDKEKEKDKNSTAITAAPRERRSTTAAASAATAAAAQNQSFDNTAKDKDNGREPSNSNKESRTGGGSTTRTSSGASQRRLSGLIGNRRSGQQLKVGGVFRAGIRRTPRKSIDQVQEKEKELSPSKEKDTKDALSAQNDKARLHDSKDSRATRPMPEAQITVNPPTTAPPVGWAYEVVTKAEDLVPKKAFTINEDHNEFKCSRPNCNKSFRKEKLLASHLKHYHNLPETGELSQQKPQSPKRGANEASSSEDQPAAKRRRGRRSRNEIEEALRNKEQQEAIAKAKQAQSGIGASAKESKDMAADLGTESSSSTDISNATIVDHQLDQVEPQQQTTNVPDQGSILAGQHATCLATTVTTLITSEVTAPSTPITTLSTTTTPAVPPKTPLYGRVGQNRFVPIPEPLVLGREKRKVVKTERMQEAEGVLLRRTTQPRANTAASHGDVLARDTATSQKEHHNNRDRRRRSHPESHIQTKEKSVEEAASQADETVDVTLKHDQAVSDDDGATTPGAEKSGGQHFCNTNTSPHTSHYRLPQDSFVEKDMVHCMCDVDEESGLMMQCDICLCWQHGSCFGIENEQLVPERYVCVACSNARRVWASQAQKQAAFRAMTEGRLPGLAPGLPITPSPRFINLARVAEVMARLKRGMQGVERRVMRIAHDSNIPAMEKRILLAVAAGDVERAHRQLDACERIVEAIDRLAGDGGACSGTSEALILRSTVKSVLKDLAAVQRLTLYK